jgi:hypothetical protein
MLTKEGAPNFGLEVSFETFTAVIFQVKVFRVVTPCNVMVEDHGFGGSMDL